MLIDPLTGFYGSVFSLRDYLPYTVRFSNIQINIKPTLRHRIIPMETPNNKKLINPNLQNKGNVNKIMGNWLRIYTCK